MIGWYDIVTSILWISGLALLLAILSHTAWWIRYHDRRWHEAVRAPSFLAPSDLSLSLITLALFLRTRQTAERILYAVCTALLIGQGILLLRKLTKQR